MKTKGIPRKMTDNSPTPEEQEKLFRDYLNHVAELWNVEPLRSGPNSTVEDARKLISCFTDPRNTWFIRSQEGLMRSAYLSTKEFNSVLAANRSTFMINSHGKITLRLKLLNATLKAIVGIYRLDEFDEPEDQ